MPYAMRGLFEDMEADVGQMRLWKRRVQRAGKGVSPVELENALAHLPTVAVRRRMVQAVLKM